MGFPVAATALFVCFWTANAARAQACSPDFELIPSPNAPGNNVLTGVAVIADNDIWAVGYSYTSTTHFETLTEHWDGARWTIVPSPSPSSISQLLAVNATATDDVWAVGVQLPGSPLPSETLIEHWDGSQWSVFPSLNPPGSPRLNAVVALATDDAWAVGQTSARAALAVHWDGIQWTVFPSPPEAGPRLAVTASSSIDVWSAGPGGTSLITHWDGASWTVVTNPSLGDAVTMAGISAVSPAEVWAVGANQFEYCDPKSCYAFLFPRLARWNGENWQPGPLPDLYGLWVGLRDISAQSGQSIWATGFQDSQTVVSHWDGERWRNAPQLQLGGFSRIAFTPAGNAWAVGTFRAGNERTLTVFYFCR